MTYVCPQCHKDTGLWRGVTVDGWQSIGGDLTPATGDGQHEIDGWSNADPTGVYGCGDCAQEFRRNDLVTLGLDGEPLPAIHPRQERLV